MSEIILKGINKIYPNGFQAVYDLNMKINDGEFITLVGPSGCGKSTTLRMIAALEDVTDGEIYINGEIANDKSPKQRKLAMVFQSYALYPHMTVFDNLAFGLELEGFDMDYIEKKVLDVSKILGLDKYLDRLPKALSGGQRQRVALGRAIIRDVDIFLMDEPLSNLDALQRVTMRSEIIDIHRKVKATTIYVTHDQTEAMTLSDRIVLMNGGIIQQIGTPKDLYFNPANMFVASFIGEPPMNLIRCKVIDDEILIDNTYFSFKINDKFKYIKKYKDVYIGFRPEVIKVNDNNSNNAFVLKVRKELTEMLGDSCNIYATIGHVSIIIKCEPYILKDLEEELEISISFENIYFFDASNERRIYGD